MKRFWFEFDLSGYGPFPGAMGFGVGATAFSKEEAIALVKQKIFINKVMPPIVKCIENVDIRTLDQGHVIPNMGVCVEYGIWFPLGYN